jgi:phage/plasmid-associated DNA primase
MQEPGSNDQIQADVMKSLTGGDRISTRELNSSQIEFKPNAKFFMACNKIPSISDLDGGVIRRLKITEFVSRFVDEPNIENVKNGIYEFKIDKELKSKLELYQGVFMCILLDYYKLYKQNGLIPPDPVLKVTKKYENDNNIIKQFIDENIIVCSKQEFITKDQLKDIYKSDYTIRNTFGKFNVFLKQLENGLCTEFKLDKKNIPKIFGWKIKPNEIDDSDED